MPHAHGFGQCRGSDTSGIPLGLTRDSPPALQSVGAVATRSAPSTAALVPKRALGFGARLMDELHLAETRQQVERLIV